MAEVTRNWTLRLHGADWPDIVAAFEHDREEVRDEEILRPETDDELVERHILMFLNDRVRSVRTAKLNVETPDVAEVLKP